MVTEKELRDLNQEVYKVDPNYKVSDQRFKYTDKTDNQLKKDETNVVKTTRSRKFKILSVKNGAYGFQGMAVAPIIKGIFDKSQVIIRSLLFSYMLSC